MTTYRSQPHPPKTPNDDDENTPPPPQTTHKQKENGSPGEIRTPVGGSKALFPCPLDNFESCDFSNQINRRLNILIIISNVEVLLSL